ncbi:MAG TPA: ABC transporter permease, partial [Bacillota bacterium]|nr:ABC transporter permease [Bacillota bacterium]
ANTVAALRRMGLAETAYSYQGGAIEDRPLAASGIMPGAIDYYAVTMLVMIIMYGSLYACFGMKESYLDAVGKRIKGSPIRGTEHYVGLVLANVVTVFLQALVVIAFTRYAYGVNWGENLPLILLITFTLVLLSIGLGTMIAMVTRSEMLAGGILNGLIPVITFMAGGYYRFSIPGKIFSALQHLSPNYLAQTAIFNTIYGGAAAHTGALLGAMGAIILGTFAVAMAAERRKFN